MGGLALHAIYGALLLTPPDLYHKIDPAIATDIESPEPLISKGKDDGKHQTRRDARRKASEGAGDLHEKEPDIPFWQQVHKRMAEDVRLFKELNFFLISLTYVSYIMGNVTLLMILPDFVVNLGYTSHQAVLLLSFFSATDLAGRLLPGWLSCCSIPLSNRAVYVSSIGMMGLLFFLYPLATCISDKEKGWILLLVLTLSCGFVSGCQMILPAVLAAEMLGHKNTAMALAFSNFICGFFSFSRPLIFSECTLE